MNQLGPSQRRSNLSRSTELAILDAIRNLDYGSVEITIHEARVVQIECRKKIRLDPQDSKCHELERS